MVSVIKLAIVISATNRASKAFTQAEAGTNKMVAAIRAMRSHMAALAAVEIVAFTRAMVDAFSQFELQMVRTATIIDEVGISTEKLEREVRRLGRTTIFTADQVASAAFRFAQAGLSTEEAFAALDPALSLAQIGLIDIAEATEIVTSVMRSMRLGLQDLERVADVLAFTAVNTKQTVSDLGVAFRVASPVAAALGISMEELAAAVGILANAGMEASIAGTAMRRIFTTLLSPSRQAQRALDQLGVVTRDSAGNFLSLTEILQQFKKAEVELGDITVILGQIFTDRALPGFLNLLAAFDEGSATFTQLKKDIDNVEAGFAANLRTQQDTLTTWATLKKIASAFRDIMIDAGEKLKPLFEDILEFMRDNADELKAIMLALIDIIKIGLLPFVPALMVIANIIVLFGPALRVVAPLIGLIVARFLILRLLMLGPVGIVILVSLVVAKLIIWLAKLEPIARLFLKIRDAAIDIQNAVGGFFAPAGRFVGDVVSGDIFSSRHRGEDFVRNSGVRFVHKGEAIVPAVENRRSIESRGKNREVNITQNITIEGILSDDLMPQIQDMGLNLLARAKYA